MSFDPIDVYFVRTYGPGEEMALDIVTDVRVFDSPYEDEDRRICYWAMRSGGPTQGAYPTHQIEEENGKIVAWRQDWTRALRVPVRVEYELLTLENFGRLAIEGRDEILATAKTSAQLRAWYREALMG